jgi:hypothetical protein
MSFGIRVIIFGLGFLLCLIVFELVRRKKFREELSLIWFIVGIAIGMSSFGDLVIDPIAQKLHIGYPPALVFIWVIFFLILALLYFSIVISDLKSRMKDLSQKIALMEFLLNEKEEDNHKGPNKVKGSD